MEEHRSEQPIKVKIVNAGGNDMVRADIPVCILVSLRYTLDLDVIHYVRILGWDGNRERRRVLVDIMVRGHLRIGVW